MSEKLAIFPTVHQSKVAKKGSNQDIFLALKLLPFSINESILISVVTNPDESVEYETP